MAFVSLCELMERLDTNVQLLWPIELGKVGDHELRLFQLLVKRFKVNKFGHLDLLENTTTLVCAKFGDVTNGERVGTFDGHLARRRVVQTLKTLDFSEGDEVSIFQAMSALIQC